MGTSQFSSTAKSQNFKFFWTFFLTVYCLLSLQRLQQASCLTCLTQDFRDFFVVSVSFSNPSGLSYCIFLYKMPGFMSLSTFLLCQAPATWKMASCFFSMFYLPFSHFSFFALFLLAWFGFLFVCFLKSVDNLVLRWHFSYWGLKHIWVADMASLGMWFGIMNTKHHSSNRTWPSFLALCSLALPPASLRLARLVCQYHGLKLCLGHLHGNTGSTGLTSYLSAEGFSDT